MRTLAATPGLSGLVFQDTVPPGYTGERTEENTGLGYTPESRLAYLRVKHVDPVDSSSGYGDTVMVNVSEENFSGFYDITIPTFSSQISDYAIWEKELRDADISLLSQCRQSAHSAAPLLPLLIRSQRSFLAAFDPWMNTAQANPASRGDAEPRPSDKLTPHSILGITYGPDERAHLNRFVQGAQILSEKGWGHQAGGEVFDLVTGGPPEHLMDTLDKLEALVKK